jgi:polysaccharide pyruvyl transferase WcaK-like protein
VDDRSFLSDEPMWAAFRAQWKGSRLPRIVLHGGYGKGNLGDDALLEALLARARREWPGAPVTVICHGPAWVRARHGVAAYHFTRPGAWRAVLRCDLYIIGSGGIIDRINAYSGFQRLRWLDPKGKYQFVAAWLARLAGARVAFCAIGATSVPDPIVGRLARLALQRADWVSLRDPLSASVLRGLGVQRLLPVVPDPVNDIVAIPAERARALLAAEGVDLGRPLVALAFRYVAEQDADNQQTVREVAQLAERLAAEYNAAVLFVPFGRHPTRAVEDDALFATAVQAQLAERRSALTVLSRAYTPAEVKGMLGLAAVCIVERLHAVLLAATAGTPVVGVIYDDKVEQYMRLVDLPARIPLREFSAQRALQALSMVAPRLQGAGKG